MNEDVKKLPKCALCERLALLGDTLCLEHRLRVEKELGR